MAKVFNMVLIVAGLMILLAFAGFPTATYQILKFSGFITIQNSYGMITDLSLTGSILAMLLFATLAAIFTLSAGSLLGSVQIGSMVINTTDSRIVAGACALLIVWVIGDLYSLLGYAFTEFSAIPWLKFFIAAILFPMMIAFAIALVQWWRGADI